MMPEASAGVDRDYSSGIASSYPDESSVAEVFVERVIENPDAVAVVDDDRRVSYQELDQWSGRLAARLVESGVEVGEPVGLIGDRSLEAIVGMLAIVKAGAAYVPLDRGDPIGRLRSLSDLLALRRVVTAPGSEGILDRIPSIGISEFRDGPAADRHPVRRGGNDFAYVMFTSGSTGVPKAVAVPHRAIARLVINTNFIEIGPTDRVTHTGHLAFDASVFEIWGALLNGARAVIVGPEVLLDPRRLEALLNRHRITVSWLSAGVFHHCARSRPAMFHRLRYLISGGDVLNPQLVRQILAAGPPANLLNGYGPTENTTFSTTYRIAEVPDDMHRIPIGRPVANSICAIVAADGSPAPVGVEGELWVGGDGVALEYVNDPGLTAERFHPDPAGRRPDARLFRTGDLAAWLPDGNIDFLGRRDRMIKFRDFRIELDEIEAELARCPGVGEAAVVTESGGGRARSIVAFYTPAPAPINGSASARNIRAWLAERLPHYMLPARLTQIERFPLTDTGKVDRIALAEAAGALGPPATTQVQGRRPRTPVQVGLARLWKEFLDADDITLDDDFFELGGNSLVAARVFARLQEVFGIGITQGRFLTSRLLAEPSLEACAAAVEEARTGTLRSGTAGTPIDFEKESRLGVPVAATAARQGPRDWTGADILLTGATGFLGSHLLRALVSRTDARIHCLVRAVDEHQAMLRLHAAQARYQLGDLPDRVVAVVGDLGQPLLGLPAEDFERYAETTDLVLHSGAYVNFTYPYTPLAAVTVGGVRELIRMAGRRGTPMHAVSTLAVLAGYGAAGVDAVTEDTPLEFVEFLHMGYTEAKWVAEALLRRAAAAGLAVGISRPYEIAGDTGHGAWNLENATCALFRLIVDMRLAPDIDLPLDLVPVDVVAAQVAHIALTRTHEAHTYHLTNPRPAMLADMVEVLRRHGYPVRQVPFADWVHGAVGYACDHPQHPFTPFVPLWIDRSPRSGLAVKEMYLQSHFPQFGRDHAVRALGDLDLPIPPVDHDLLDRYVRFFQQAGFFPPPPTGHAREPRVPNQR
jgi:amino acid adenylation domain-containing protein/thioester reductase-like protein